ncbi:MAG: TIM barrel protein [Candidatus ainarchaeum sp.]|nr:TIM barrel protein [Candidatus ainarchaeum sp.]
MNQLIFGTAGIPFSTIPRTTENGVKKIKEIGLGAMELEFVQSVNLSENKAVLVNKIREENGVYLTCHGSYYINLNAEDIEKVEKSKERIIHAAKIASIAGAKSITFHAGFYLGFEKLTVYNTIKKNLSLILDELKNEKINIEIRPETTGKETQFGSLDELLNLSQEIGILPCIDFSHIYARSVGKNNTLTEFRQIFEKCENKLGKNFLKNLHCHMSGIEFTQKGERKHLPFKESEFNYIDLLKTFKEFDAKGIVICESPLLENDALLLKEKFEKL